MPRVAKVSKTLTISPLEELTDACNKAEHEKVCEILRGSRFDIYEIKRRKDNPDHKFAHTPLIEYYSEYPETWVNVVEAYCESHYPNETFETCKCCTLLQQGKDAITGISTKKDELVKLTTELVEDAIDHGHFPCLLLSIFYNGAKIVNLTTYSLVVGRLDCYKYTTQIIDIEPNLLNIYRKETQLDTAIRSGHIAIVDYLLKQFEGDEYKRYIRDGLWLAAQLDKLEIVELILTFLDATTFETHREFIIQAVEVPQYKITELIIKHYCEYVMQPEFDFLSCIAIRTLDIRKLELILSIRGVDYAAEEHDGGASSLCVAVSYDFFEAVDLLFAYGYDINKDKSLTEVGFYVKSQKMVEKLESFGIDIANIEWLKETGAVITPLTDPPCDMAFFKYLKEKCKPSNPSTLSQAVSANNVTMVKECLKDISEEELNAFSFSGISPIFSCYSYEMFELLVEAGANIHPVVHHGYGEGCPLTLWYAMQWHNSLMDLKLVLSYLVSHGVDPNFIHPELGGLLSALIEHRFSSVLIPFALDLGCDPAKDFSAFNRAISTGNTELAELLCHFRHDVDGLNSYGETILMSAAQANSVPAIEKLLGLGFDLNSRCCDGMSLLGLTLSNNTMDALDYLLDAGADVNYMATAACLPLDLALLNKNQEAFYLLIAYGASPGHFGNYVKDNFDYRNELDYCAYTRCLSTTDSFISPDALLEYLSPENVNIPNDVDYHPFNATMYKFDPQLSSADELNLVKDRLRKLHNKGLGSPYCFRAAIKFQRFDLAEFLADELGYDPNYFDLEKERDAIQGKHSTIGLPMSMLLMFSSEKMKWLEFMEKRNVSLFDLPEAPTICYLDCIDEPEILPYLFRRGVDINKFYGPENLLIIALRALFDNANQTPLKNLMSYSNLDLGIELEGIGIFDFVLDSEVDIPGLLEYLFSRGYKSKDEKTNEAFENMDKELFNITFEEILWDMPPATNSQASETSETSEIKM
eukprot:TRINITY_DN775_c0_g1_i1.p1 TRINITY_DN775_c0_g1~~TRINITY_DN775_c0_g1_i1.p1  ORF type:complete len:992 (+),score=265.30 TRINITY_DN775_c0_g1_i1:31-2976(+)